MHADLFMFVAHFGNRKVDEIFEYGFQPFKSGIPLDDAAKLVFLCIDSNQLCSALNPLGLGFGWRSNFLDFFNQLQKTVVKKLNFGL